MTSPNPSTRGRCARATCHQPAKTRGWCESDYRRFIRKGVYGYVDPAPAIAHLGRLRELGWTWELIAERAGLSTSTAHGVFIGRYRRFRRDSAAAILALPLTAQRSHNGVDAIGARRRVHALGWMGWPAREIAERVGVPAATITTLIYRGRMSRQLALDVAVVYERLHMTPGPSRIAATKARNSGHAPPMAWDADTIDDPAAKPVGVAA